MPATSTILLTALSLSAARSWLELIAYREPGCSGGEDGDGGGKGGEGGEEGGGGGEGRKGGEGGEEGGGGGEGDGEVKQILKPPLTANLSETQLRAEASTPSGPSVPE